MGSACHQLGVYDVLPKLQALIQTHGLTDQVELKGSFCLETCSHGIVMKFHDTCFTNISPQNVEAIFETQILPAIQGAIACLMVIQRLCWVAPSRYGYTTGFQKSPLNHCCWS
jgi:hypothetical protein